MKMKLILGDQYHGVGYRILAARSWLQKSQHAKS